MLALRSGKNYGMKRVLPVFRHIIEAYAIIRICSCNHIYFWKNLYIKSKILNSVISIPFLAISKNNPQCAVNSLIKYLFN